MTGILSLPLELFLDIIKITLPSFPDICQIPEVYTLLKPLLRIVQDHDHTYDEVHANQNEVPFFLRDPQVTRIIANKTDTLTELNIPSSTMIIYIDLHKVEYSLNHVMSAIPLNTINHIHINYCTRCSKEHEGYKNYELRLRGLDLNVIDQFLKDATNTTHIHFDNPRIMITDTFFTRDILLNSTFSHLHLHSQIHHNYRFCWDAQEAHSKLIDQKPELQRLVFHKLKTFTSFEYPDTNFIHFILSRSPGLQTFTLTSSDRNLSPISNCTLVNLTSLTINSNEKLVNINLPNLLSLNINIQGQYYTDDPTNSHYETNCFIDHLHCPRLKVFDIHVRDGFPMIKDFTFPEDTLLVIGGDQPNDAKVDKECISSDFLLRFKRVKIKDWIVFLTSILPSFPEIIEELEISVIEMDGYTSCRRKTSLSYFQRFYVYFCGLRFPELRKLKLSPIEFQNDEFRQISSERHNVFYPGPYIGSELEELTLAIAPSTPKLGTPFFHLLQTITNQLKSLFLDFERSTPDQTDNISYLWSYEFDNLQELSFIGCSFNPFPNFPSSVSFPKLESISYESSASCTTNLTISSLNAPKLSSLKIKSFRCNVTITNIPSLLNLSLINCSCLQLPNCSNLRSITQTSDIDASVTLDCIRADDVPYLKFLQYNRSSDRAVEDIEQFGVQNLGIFERDIHIIDGIHADKSACLSAR